MLLDVNNADKLYHRATLLQLMKIGWLGYLVAVKTVTVVSIREFKQSIAVGEDPFNFTVKHQSMNFLEGCRAWTEYEIMILF